MLLHFVFLPESNKAVFIECFQHQRYSHCNHSFNLIFFICNFFCDFFSILKHKLLIWQRIICQVCWLSNNASLKGICSPVCDTHSLPSFLGQCYVSSFAVQLGCSSVRKLKNVELRQYKTSTGLWDTCSNDCKMLLLV